MRASSLGEYYYVFFKTVSSIPSKMAQGAVGVGRKRSVLNIFSQLSLPFCPENC